MLYGICSWLASKYSNAAIGSLHQTRESPQEQLDFILAEVELGSTFAQIALTTTNPEKFERNKDHARNAYNQALHFIHKTPLRDGERETLMLGMAKLRAALALLDERV
jgi:hypothetical protein